MDIEVNNKKYELIKDYEKAFYWNKKADEDRFEDFLLRSVLLLFS